MKAWKLVDNNWAIVGTYGGDNAHSSSITALVSKGDVTVSGARNGDFKVWSTTQGSLVNTVEAHQGGIRDIEYWENNAMKVIITCGNDAAIRVWDFKKKKKKDVS